MRNWFMAAGLWLALAFAAEAAGPNEEYVRLYTLMQQGETMEGAGQMAQALAAYLDARQGLLRLKRSQPDWNSRVVDFRLRYLEDKIQRLTPQARVAPDPVPAVAAPTVSPADSLTSTSTPEVEAELQSLRLDLDRAQAENRLLQAKLREALSAIPSAADPVQLQKAQERQRELVAEVAALREQLVTAGAQRQEQFESKAVEETQAELARTLQALERQTRLAEQLGAERAALETRVQSMAAPLEALRAENDLIKGELAELKRQRPATGGAKPELDRALAELAMLRSEADILRLEKIALEQRVSSGDAGGVQLRGARGRIEVLERERGELQRQLLQSQEELAARSLVIVGEPTGAATEQVARMQARLAVVEAQAIPYSIEEEALFRLGQTPAQPAERSARPISSEPALLQAELHFQRGDLTKSVEVLNEVLHREGTNAFTLGNLAAVQLELGQLAHAEANLRQALALAPRDPFVLMTLGRLRFEQEDYDEALDYLSLAAQYHPRNAAIQNYLGVTLSQKGLRGPAETALRKAIQLQPGMPQAHYNLALVYSLQDPPSPQLARWHYQRALENGHPRITDLEQLLEEAAGRTATP